MITLGSFQFPESCAGLRWSDEFDWSPVVDSVSVGLTGSLLVQTGIRRAGRPMTLEGGRSGSRSYAWLTRSEVMTLSSLLEQISEQTITLHDGRSFTVIPNHGSEGPLSVSPVPIIDDVGPADPGGDWNYVVNAVRFLILAEL